jgi:uncharacterized membrane protein YfcA
MEFLGTPDIGPLAFFGLMLASLVTSFIGVFTGAAGGIVLLGLMATVMPPLALIPVHTVVMLGSGVTRTMIMWRHVMRPAVLPFIVGSLIGAALGARVFVSLTTVWLEFILGAFILLVTWMPKLGRFGAERSRFGVLGFATTFLGVFVSATGTLLAPFIAASTPDRRVHVATMGALMMTSHLAKVAAFGFIGFAIGHDRNRRGRQLGWRGGAVAHQGTALPPGAATGVNDPRPASVVERGTRRRMVLTRINPFTCAPRKR